MPKRAPTRSIAQRINQASRLFASLGDALLRPLSLRYAQVPVLALLRQHRTLTQADLTRLVGVEQSSMAQLLGRMERDGVVDRAPHLDDARMSSISLARAFAKRLTEARARLDALDADACAGLAPEEVATLTALLDRVVTNLRRTEER